MSETKGHGFDWADLRDRPASELAVGDTFVSGLGAFASYTVSRDGRVRPLMGCEPPGGTAWTVTAKEGDRVTARSHHGHEESADTPPRARVLLVVPPEPVGTVLAVNSHRARERLERVLGRKPAAYWTMQRGGKFVVLYGEDVSTALGITSITRTRLKPEDVGLCISMDGQEYERREADRAAGRKVRETAS
jgi:hypothetical protein